MIKEIVLQALFPRVCPVCGKILKLPRGWAKELTDPSKIPLLSPKAVHRFRSILICGECRKKIRYVSDPKCRICSRPMDEGEGNLCDICRKTVHTFDQGSALLVHDSYTKKILYDLKFRNKRDNADWVGFEMALRFSEQVRKMQPDVLIPVPLHKKRMQERGFNQAQLIAERFSFWLEKLSGIRLCVDADYLQRVIPTKPQRTLESGQRAGNVRDAFAVLKRAPYRRIVLVDDIFTSGSTLDACAKALKAAGAKQVFFLSASIVS